MCVCVCVGGGGGGGGGGMVLPYKIRLQGRSDKNWPKCPNFANIS